MPKSIEVICTNCPMGCKITLKIDEKYQKVLSVEGNKCKQGKLYAVEEFMNPTRVLTATVRTSSLKTPLLPVRTTKPIPIGKMKEIMYSIAEIIIKKPLKIGQIIDSNISNMGIDLIATADYNDC